MSIYYALVARGPIILVEFTEHNGNFQQITSGILQSVDVSSDSMCSYTSDKYTFHVVINSGLVFLCMTDLSLRKSIAYSYLNEIKTRFMQGTLMQRAYNCNAYELKDVFEPVLRQQMSRYNKSDSDLDGNGRIRDLQDDVDGLKSVMTENIGKLLERGERLDILCDKTDDLSRSSESFVTTSKKLKNKMWWKNKKICLILSCLILIIIAVIVIVVLSEFGVFKKSLSTTTTSPKLTTLKPPTKATTKTTTTTTTKPPPTTTKLPTTKTTIAPNNTVTNLKPNNTTTVTTAKPTNRTSRSTG